MRTYRCAACDGFLFNSNAPYGRAEAVRCTNRDCRKSQTVRFGRPPMPTPPSPPPHLRT
jgi:hypothetical protein